LNGTLLHRGSAKNLPDRWAWRRGAAAFVADLRDHPGISLMIWSSARMSNVKKILGQLEPSVRRELETRKNPDGGGDAQNWGEGTGMPGSDKVAPGREYAAVWGREHFGLSLEDYKRRVQVYKRLTRIWDSPAEPQRSSIRWDQSNTVLVDDGAEKARQEPHNLGTCDHSKSSGGCRGVCSS
jgi:hypothetical protein